LLRAHASIEDIAAQLLARLNFDRIRVEAVIAGPELKIVLGMRAWRAALGRAGVSPEENRAALAGTTT
jgi:hypothetical protein